MAAPIVLVVADGSALVLEALRLLLTNGPGEEDFELAAAVQTADELFAAVEDARPDVVVVGSAILGLGAASCMSLLRRSRPELALLLLVRTELTGASLEHSAVTYCTFS